MPALLHKAKQINVSHVPARVRSDWRQGILVQGYRGERTRRIFHVLFADQSRALWQHLAALHVEAGCGAGEITWPEAPGGSVVVRKPQMPAIAEGAQRYQITAELEELLSTDT